MVPSRPHPNPNPNPNPNPSPNPNPNRILHGALEAVNPGIDAVASLGRGAAALLPGLRRWLGETTNRAMWCGVLLSLER